MLFLFQFAWNLKLEKALSWKCIYLYYTQLMIAFCNKMKMKTQRRKRNQWIRFIFYISFFFGCKHIINVTRFSFFFSCYLHKIYIKKIWFFFFCLFELCNLFSWNDKMSVFGLLFRLFGECFAIEKKKWKTQNGEDEEKISSIHWFGWEWVNKYFLFFFILWPILCQSNIAW